MPSMRAVQVTRPGGPLEPVERSVPEPGPGALRIKVHACGVCHSDSITKEGLFPGIQYPRVPGHEVVGVIDAVGPRAPGWETGERVGSAAWAAPPSRRSRKGPRPAPETLWTGTQGPDVRIDLV